MWAEFIAAAQYGLDLSESSMISIVTNFDQRTFDTLYFWMNNIMDIKTTTTTTHSYNIQINHSFANNIFQIILSYSHTNIDKFYIEYKHKNEYKLEMLKYITNILEFLIQACCILSIILQIVTFILLCYQFAIWDNKYDSWHKYLSFNSMLLFHPSYKYCSVAMLLIFRGDADSDDDFDDFKRELESSALAAFYAQKKFFILILLSVATPTMQYLGASFPVYFPAFVVYLWPFLAISIGISIIGGIFGSVGALLKTEKKDIKCKVLFGVCVMICWMLFVTLVVSFWSHLYFSIIRWYRGDEWSDCVIYVWKSEYCSDPVSFPLFWQFDNWTSIIVGLS